MRCTYPLLVTVLIVTWPGRAAADPPKLRELRVQQVGKTTYFHIGFDAPPGLATSEDVRLVPQDNQTHAVYSRRLEAGTGPQVRRNLFDGISAPARPAPGANEQPRAPVPVVGLEFAGKCGGKGKAGFVLLYPTTKDRSVEWIETLVELDFDQAKRLADVANSPARQANQPPQRDDLEGLWASAQAAYFASINVLDTEYSFYSFAVEATGRRYAVPTESLRTRWAFPGTPREFPRQLYETTTGAAAITESLQLDRMIGGNLRDKGERKIEIAKLPGVDIAEHPWLKMMGDKKPATEPLARLVPDDNYYVRFHDIRKFIEMNELIEQWGTSLVRAYEVHSKDYQLKQRYEHQLCLRSSLLGKTLGPLVVRDLALTGSDGSVREGSDLSILFDVRDSSLFLAAVEPFLQEARKQWAGQLQESKETYHDVVIERFVTPLREVSLHRATLGSFVIYSNSPAAVRRIIDTKQGRHKALADSLDFQYMRTIYRADEAEDGFAFLSDPFIRQLVGPASKIKEKRRLEALTSLTMATNDALFTAWQTGKLPAGPQELAAVTVLKPDELYTPEGKGVTWDTSRNLAVSDVYGTIHFATPLVELPIEMVTETEQRDYLQFRGEYMGLWRRYFDPVGMRFALNDRQVRIETYILPLIKNTEYNELRSRTGDGTTPLADNGFSPKTVAQLVSHISPNAPERGQLQQALTALGALGNNKGLDWLGDWFMVRLDDSDIYAKIAALMLHEDGRSDGDTMQAMELAFQTPLTVGFGIRNPLVFAGVLTGLRGAVNAAAPGLVTWAPMEPDYKGTTVVRIQAQGNQVLGLPQNPNRKEPFQPSLYYAIIDGGCYVSLRRECLEDIIDRNMAGKEGKLPKLETIPVNSSLYLSPQAATKAKTYVRVFLERLARQQALASEPLWYMFYRTRLLAPDASDKTARATTFHYLGFSPVSADGAPYHYQAKTDEVTNERYGSLRVPKPSTKEASNQGILPVEQLLDEFQTLRADLRFREDGINTVLTIERKGKTK